MAFYETKTLQIANDPRVIDAVTQEEGIFMWELKGQQITDTQDSHTEHYVLGDTLYEKTITNSKNYCTMTLQRDKTIPYYDMVVRLEDELRERRGVDNERPKGSGFWENICIPVGGGLIGGEILAVILPAILGKSTFANVVATIAFIACAGFGIFMAIKGSIDDRMYVTRRRNELKTQKMTLRTQEEILQEAMQLQARIIREM